MSFRAFLACALLWCSAGAGGGAAGPACAQDFAGAAHAAAGDDPFALLERALPPAGSAFCLATSQTRWWNLADLETRAAAVGGGWRTLRTALGLSQTGGPELGWTALGFAAGSAGTDLGAAFRVCARVDRDAPWSVARAASTAAGFELGCGAWIEPAAGMHVWASAPQAFVHGVAPPLTRALELGLSAGDGNGAWFVLRAPRAGDDGERALGITLAVSPLTAWAEVRDGPLRGAVGMRAQVAVLCVEARVDSHPVLGETVRVALAWWRARRTAR